jgi:hypothetical protein
MQKPTSNLKIRTKVFGAKTPLAQADDAFAHLHLAVQNVNSSITVKNGSSVADVQSRTMSLLQAYWKLQNRFKESSIGTL